MNIFCKLGLHSWRYSERWLPDFSAEIIEEVKFYKICKRCSKEVVYSEFKLGEDF